jgi:hypothetical protein
MGDKCCDTPAEALVPLPGKNCAKGCELKRSSGWGAYGAIWIVVIIIIIFVIVVAGLWCAQPSWLQSSGPDGAGHTNIGLLLVWAIAIIIVIFIILALLWAVLRMFTG